jgi:predicted DNA-binding transcriptional regulator AlpA
MNDKEAAESCGLKPSTLRKWRLQGRGPRWRRFGRAVRYLVSDLEEWQNTQPAGGDEVAKTLASQTGHGAKPEGL